MPDTIGLKLIEMARREEKRHEEIASNVRVPYATFKQSLDQYVAVVAKVGKHFDLVGYTRYTWDELELIAKMKKK